MKARFVLTLDFGTQSVRALIFNQNGEVLASEKEAYEQPYFSVEPGYCEQYPDYYYQKLCIVTKRLMELHSEFFAKVECVVMTCFRDTAVLLDENKEVIRPAVLWLDQRKAKLIRKTPLINKLLFSIVGMYGAVKMSRERTPAIWIQENEKENWGKTKHYMTISTYFTYRLIGEIKDSCANQTGHFPINFKQRKWYKDGALKGAIFNIPRKLLCDLVNPGDLLGSITKKCSQETGLKEGLKLYAAGTDKGCETIGTGCITNDVASISYGTASSIEVSNPKYRTPERFLPTYPAAIPGLYNMEVQIYRGYWMITWFKNEFAEHESVEASIQKMAVEEVLNQKLMKIPPGSQGLVLQPYWGPGLKRPDAKGSIIGFSDFHTKAHFYRAIIEGVAYGLRDGLEGIERRQHKKIKRITISGGGSQSDAICQITADIFGVPTNRVQTFETGCLGAAIVGFKAIGVYDSYEEAVKKMVHVSSVFQPNMKNHEKYDYLFKKVYVKMYGKLSKIYRKIRDFNNI